MRGANIAVAIADKRAGSGSGLVQAQKVVSSKQSAASSSVPMHVRRNCALHCVSTSLQLPAASFKRNSALSGSTCIQA